MANRGFFAGSTLAQSRAPAPTIPQCGACGLHRGCRSPKMPYTGEGRRGILIIGEAPGEQEDKQNAQFVGPAGSLLRRTLNSLGVSLDRDCWKTNALICRPPNNATPDDKQIGYCRPNLTQTIADLGPTTIIPMGGPAVAALLGPYWREGIGPVGRWVGWQIPLQPLNAWVCPTWHPSFIMRGEEGRRPEEDVAKRLWRGHLQEAFNLTGPPWTVVPDYRKEVECIHDPATAAAILDDLTARGGPMAWDLETNALKPEGANARIISSAVCWRGRRTVAYPWHGPAIAATRRFVRSPVPKIVGNLKFEERWALEELGTPVRNWVHDTVLSAHHLDCRKGITSVKFQGFVQLGLPTYDEHIAEFLGTSDEEEINEVVRQVDLRDLLTYNALDTLVEYRVAVKQRRAMGL